MTAPRPPAVAGQFYPADGRELARAIESAFLDRRGPGHLPTRHRSPERHLRAAIVPHAGYVYSGPIAALAFDRIAAERPPESVLVLGVDHYGRSSGASLSRRPWVTPLGPTGVDTGLVDRLNRGPVEVDEDAHAQEHSIEVELPFLEYVVPKPEFVALMVRFGPLDFLKEVASVVIQAIQGRDVLLLASTDFSHYVSPERADDLDHRAIEPILKRDAEGLYRTVERHNISMCGIAPTTVLLLALASESLSATLLRWGHSGEAEPMDRVVGYAALTLSSAGPL